MQKTVHNSMVSYQKGPTHHAYAWQIRPFWQDTYPRTQGRGEGKVWHVLCEFIVWILSCDCQALCNIVYRAIYKEDPLHLDIMPLSAKKNIN